MAEQREAIAIEDNGSKYSRKQPYGWILYANGDRGFNPHYVGLYQSACKKREMSVALGMYDQTAGKEQIACQLRRLSAEEKPMYVINRTRDYEIAQLLESFGIRVFNPSFIAKIGNDKSEAYRYMQQRGIPIMPTALYTEDTTPQWYPAVVKSSGGHGGTEVFYIRDEADWNDWKIRCRQREKQYVIQQAASDAGKDLRVYVVGNKIKAAVMRMSNNDFRSNYCLGGSVQMYELSKSERHLVKRAIEGLSIGMAGIDFIFHHGNMIFNEIEDMAGARALYRLTDYDIVDDYIHVMQEELNNAADRDKSADM